MKQNYVFTSESVSEGHPDKVCDQISDRVLDLFLERDPQARVACETLVTKDAIVLAGETRSQDAPALSAIEEAVRQMIKKIGYRDEGFHWQKTPVDIKMHRQSPDIAQGVDAEGDASEGAGDQGIMFGYACRETKELMPAPIQYSNRILEALALRRHQGELPELGPDAKTQVSVAYMDGRPTFAKAVVLSTQHSEALSTEQVAGMVKPVIHDILPDGWIREETRFYINPTGRFVIGGPVGDAGLTGRKIIVDTYGGSAPHGGGAFSGKDPTKVDRSAAYAARYLAKNVVAANLADRCLIQLSYAIGVPEPVSIYIDTFGTVKGVTDERLAAIISEIINLTPKGIRSHLQLNRPIYTPTAAYGHFGRKPQDNGSFSWEKTDLVDALKSSL